MCWWTPAFISHISWVYNNIPHSAIGASGPQTKNHCKSLSKMLNSHQDKKVTTTERFNLHARKCPRNLWYKMDLGVFCQLQVCGLKSLCQKLKRSMSPARQSPARNRLMEWSISKFPTRMQIRTAIKTMCQVIWIHTFLLLPPGRKRDYVMLKPWLRIQHLVSWTSSAAVSLRWHLRNGHKIHLMLPTACETDNAYRRLAK